MPFFSSERSRQSSPEAPSPTRKPTLFSFGHRTPSPDPQPSSPRSRGFFGRQRSSASSSSASESGRKNGRSSSSSRFLNGNRARDPTIVAARQKVIDAENAERDADRALMQARDMVRVAREHVRNLEREAINDAKRAKAKQAEAKIVSKSAKGLGRHG